MQRIYDIVNEWGWFPDHSSLILKPMVFDLKTILLGWFAELVTIFEESSGTFNMFNKFWICLPMFLTIACVMSVRRSEQDFIQVYQIAGLYNFH